MKNLTWQNPEQLFVAQELINKVKSKCCGIKGNNIFKLLIAAGLSWVHTENEYSYDVTFCSWRLSSYSYTAYSPEKWKDIIDKVNE